MLKSELEKLKQEKESNNLKIENFDNASKSLDKLIGGQITDKSRKGVGFISYNAVPPPYTGLFSPPKLDLSNSGLEEFQQPKFEGYGPKTSKSVSEDVSNEVIESPDAPLVKELVLDDKLEKKTVFPTVAKIEFVKPKQQEKPVRKPANCNYHQRERVVSGDNYIRVNYNYPAKKAHPSAHRNIVLRKFLMKTGLRPLNTAKPVNTAHPKTIVYSARPMSRFTKSVQSTTSWNLIEDMLPLGEEPKEGKLLMCDKKNSVLFTDTGCFVLSPDLKLAYESQVLLKVPRKNNMYSVDMKNIVPKESLTCLVSKATLDESMLWHRRLGHNRVLVVKPHNKTPYELFRGRTSALSFMRPFGCHVTILNTLDYLGKFDGKSNQGFFIGYSMNSKAFRVYNIRTRKVEENLHIRFLEDKPIIVGNGPKWLFDIDVLTKSMNYVPVVVGTNSNDLVGTEESIGAGHCSKETGSSEDYILMPMWKDGSLFDSSL
ncbi:ribonuclease H-like domain-containing protein, partial [Tanacetum coccineum]